MHSKILAGTSGCWLQKRVKIYRISLDTNVKKNISKNIKHRIFEEIVLDVALVIC